MSKRTNNPPAFPNLGHNADFSYNGMSMRDWFAGQALTGILANGALVDMQTATAQEWVARHAYMQADAMLKARQA